MAAIPVTTLQRTSPPRRHARGEASRARGLLPVMVVLGVFSGEQPGNFVAHRASGLMPSRSTFRWQGPQALLCRRCDSLVSRLATLSVGDKVETYITDELGWIAATVEHVFENGNCRVVFQKDGYEYHCIPEVWRQRIGAPTSSTRLEEVVEEARTVQAQEVIPAAKMEDLEVAQKLRGRITALRTFGAFVDVGLEDEVLLHITRMTTSYVSRVSDVFKVGDVGDFYVLDKFIEEDGRPRVNLTAVNIWEIQRAQEEGRWIKGRIAVVEKAFVFVELPDFRGSNGRELLGRLMFLSASASVTADTAVVGQQVLVRVASVNVAVAGSITISLTMKPASSRSMGDGEKRVSDFETLKTWIAGKEKEMLEATVRDVTEFGLSIDMEGGPGFVPRKELPDSSKWQSFQPGDTLRVRLLSLSPLKGNAVMSLRPLRNLSLFEKLDGNTWLNATVLDGSCNPLLVAVEPPGGGDPHAALLPRNELGTTPLGTGQRTRVRITECNIAKDRLAVSAVPSADLSLFDGIPDDIWLDGTVVETSILKASVMVEPPGGGPPALGSVNAVEVRMGFPENVSEELKVSQKIRVRVLGRQVTPAGRTPGLKLSMKNRTDLTPFQSVPDSVWLPGTVMDLSPGIVVVGVEPPGGGPMQEGTISKGLLSLRRVQDARDIVKVGELVQVRVDKVDTQTNRLSLSMIPKQDYTPFRQIGHDVWLGSEVLRVSPVEVMVGVIPPGATHGAQEMQRGRIPLNELGSANADVVEGQQLRVRVLRADKDQLLLSSRKTVNLEPFNGVSSSEWLEGTVSLFCDVGVIVAVAPPGGGEVQEGLVALERMPRNQEASVLKPGAKVQVRVLATEEGSERLNLSMLEQEDISPFEKIPEDQWLQASVMEVDVYGAFVTVKSDGHEAVGFLPKSEVGTAGFSDDPRDELTAGETLEVRVVVASCIAERLEVTMRPKRDLTGFRTLPPGTKLRGIVRSIQPDFGAVLVVARPHEMEPGDPENGLLQLSRLSEEVKVGDPLSVVVTRVEEDWGYLEVDIAPP